MTAASRHPRSLVFEAGETLSVFSSEIRTPSRRSGAAMEDFCNQLRTEQGRRSSVEALSGRDVGARLRLLFLDAESEKASLATFLFFASLNAAPGADFWCGVVESLEDRLKKLRNSLSGIRIEPIN